VGSVTGNNKLARRFADCNVLPVAASHVGFTAGLAFYTASANRCPAMVTG